MSVLRIPPKAKPFIGIFSSDRSIIDRTINILERKLGIKDFVSNEFIFSDSDYYNEEMGSPLYRKFVSFSKLIPREKLIKIKILSDRIEKKFSIIKNSKLCRTVNIDPGILTPESFILSTGKGYAHRIYINRGVWLETTLIRKNGKYEKLEWTYPDYKRYEIISIIENIRILYMKQLNGR